MIIDNMTVSLTDTNNDIYNDSFNLVETALDSGVFRSVTVSDFEYGSSRPFGTYADGNADENVEVVSTTTIIEEIPEENKFKIRVFDSSKTESEITLTLESISEEGTIVETNEIILQKVGNYYESVDSFVSFDGEMPEEARTEISSQAVPIHNEVIKAIHGEIWTKIGTYLLGVDIENEHPNILVATSKQVTATEQKTIIIFKGAKSLKGKQVEFSADAGTVDGENSVTKTVPANGELTIEYIPPADPGTRTVTAKIKGSTVGVQTFVYVAEYDFLDLSNNPKMADFNDTKFTNNNAMSQQDIQKLFDFLDTYFTDEERGSGCFYATYTTGGKSAAQIIKEAANAHGINPKIIIATLEKEEGGVISKIQNVDKAMGHQTAVGFDNQVNESAQNMVMRLNQTILWFPINHKSLQKAIDEGKTGVYETQNHLYSVPGDKNINVAVAFKPANQSSYAQNRFTTSITHRSNTKISLPVGGVYRFMEIWRALYETPYAMVVNPKFGNTIQGGEQYNFMCKAYSFHGGIQYSWKFKQTKEPIPGFIATSTLQNFTLTLHNTAGIYRKTNVRAILEITANRGYSVKKERKFYVLMDEE